MRGQRAISAFAPALMSDNITRPEDLKVGDVVIGVRSGSGIVAGKTFIVEEDQIGEFARFRQISGGDGRIRGAYVNRVKKL